MPNYADPATALIDWLTTVITVARDATTDAGYRRLIPEDPDTMAVDDLPLGVIVRVGGADRELGLDVVRLNIDTYCTGPDPYAARGAALARAEDIRRAVRLWLPGQWMGDLWVSKTRTESAPTIRPYAQTQAIRKAQAVYELHLHNAL